LSDTGPVCAHDEMQEFEVWWYSHGPAPRHEHVVSKMVTIILCLVVWPQEDLDAMPRGLNRVSVGPRVRIDKPKAMIDGAVRVTLRLEIVISTPAIADDRHAWFNPFTYNSHQRVGGPVQNGNKKCSAGPSFHTAKHLLTLNRVPSIVLASTNLALINLDDLSRTTDFLRAARQVIEHSFPAEHTPVSNRMVTEVIFVSDLVGTFTAQDVVCNDYNFSECEITQLEPRAVPNGRRRTALNPSNTPMTSPSKSVTTGACLPRHISFAGVTLHLTLNKAHVLQKLNRQFVVTKKAREKHPIWCTVSTL